MLFFFLLLFLGESEAVFSVGIFLRMVPCFPLVLYSNLMISVILLPVLLYRRDCHWESVSSSLHTWIIYLGPFYFLPLLLISSRTHLFCCHFFSHLHNLFFYHFTKWCFLFRPPRPSFGHFPLSMFFSVAPPLSSPLQPLWCNFLCDGCLISSINSHGDSVDSDDDDDVCDSLLWRPLPLSLCSLYPTPTHPPAVFNQCKVSINCELDSAPPPFFLNRLVLRDEEGFGVFFHRNDQQCEDEPLKWVQTRLK